MANKFYLIQRGQFRNNLKEATGLFGGRSENLINPEYMGSAEFEWGAIPRAFRRIMGQYDKYKLLVTDLRTLGGVPFCVYCREDRYEAVLEAIKQYLEKSWSTKEWTNLRAHFKPLPPNAGEWSRDHLKYELKTNFWWCIDVSPVECEYSWDRITGDWIAFTGATDRQNAFTRVMEVDYNEWWMKKSEEERSKDFLESFKR